MEVPNVNKDDSGKIVETKSESFAGPLGIWPFPIINALASNANSRVEVTQINRDDEGRIESIEEIKL